jgi:hypothetical protein
MLCVLIKFVDDLASNIVPILYMFMGLSVLSLAGYDNRMAHLYVISSNEIKCIIQSLGKV